MYLSTAAAAAFCALFLGVLVGRAMLYLPDVFTEPRFAADFYADYFIYLGVALAMGDFVGVLLADFIGDLLADLAGVFFALAGRAGVAALEAGDFVFGIEAGFFAATAFLAFATVTFLPAGALGVLEILVAGFFAGAFLGAAVFFADFAALTADAAFFAI